MKSNDPEDGNVSCGSRVGLKDSTGSYNNTTTCETGSYTFSIMVLIIIILVIEFFIMLGKKGEEIELEY